MVQLFYHEVVTDFGIVILQNHRFSYGEPMTVESTTQALCDLALRFGEGDEESMVIIAITLSSGSFVSVSHYA